MPGAPSSASTHSPESSARAAWPLPAADATALIFALAAKVVPSSIGSGRPSDPALTGRMPCGPSSALISRTLPSLCEATTKWLPRGNFTTKSSCQNVFLQRHQFADALARQLEQRHQLFLGEGRAFRGALNFHQAARAGQHKIGVRLGGGILLVIQVQQRLALNDAAADRRDMVLDDGRRHQPGLLHEADALAEGDKAAGDRRGPGAAIGLQHVAVDGDLPLAQRCQIAY